MASQQIDGQQLLYDWRFRFPGDPDAHDGWSYHWENAKCSTSNPTPRDSWATLFMTTNHTEDPFHDFQDFVSMFNKKRKRSIQIELQSKDDSPRQPMALKEDGVVLATGKVFVKSGVEHADPNLGYYAELLSRTPKGLELLLSYEASATHGYAALLHHSEVLFPVAAEGLQLRVRTGWGPEGLATRFAVEESEAQVARCHLSYRDGSYDPSVGPTIEMMSVHKTHRGHNLLPLLYHWVKSFVEENWKLECMNTECQPGHIMLKVTQLTNAIVDTHNGKEITDKEFFYQYAGFGVRRQQGAKSCFIAPDRPKDEEGVVYLSLLSKGELSERSKPRVLPTVDWRENLGPRSCAFCDAWRQKLLRCTRCRKTWYCDIKCQRKDWGKGHKHWCGKTREEVYDKLVELGLGIS